MRPSIPRTLVVGLDGATPQLLFPWIERGDLPVLGELLQDSAWGPLRSVMPPMTLPAWSSFLTGRSPGDHGIFDFTVRQGGRLRFVDARDRAVPTIPRLLSDRGLRVGTLLFPTTWPPEPLSGGQVSGFDSPVATRVPPSAYAPRELHSWVRRLLGRDLTYADFSELRKGRGWEGRAAAALLQGIEDKERVACSLLQQEPPYDFFAILFGESDTASHHFWHLADPLSPRHDPSLAATAGDTIAAVYRRLDAAIGAMLRAGPGFESVVVASDHGFGGASDRVLHLNSFLAEQGFLRWRTGTSPARKLGGGLSRLLPSALLDRAVRAVPRSMLERWDAEARWGSIDFSRSEVFSDELNYAPSLRLNLAGRDPQGVVPSGPGSEASRALLLQRLERALLAWRDPVDGSRVVRAVHPRESLYEGPCLDRAPDLYLELETPGGWSYNVLPSEPGGPSTGRLPRSQWRGFKGAGMSGSHRRDGIFVLRAPGVSSGRRSMDIAQVLPEWLEAVGLGGLESAPAELPAGGARPEAPADSRALAARLRGLGYLA